MKHKFPVSLVLFLTVFNCFGQSEGAKPIQISGIYPSLVMYNTKPFGPTFNTSAGETGVGALVPWNNKLWAVTYAAHQPFGGADKLYEIDKDLKMVARPESIGGTHADRMIHKESRQLIIGPYFIDSKGKVRSVSSDKMPGRLTAVARHLTDPANKVYFFTMEKGLYEVDVNSLAVKTIHLDGNVEKVPEGVSGPAALHGYHGKGGYTGQGRLIVSNNGVRPWQNALKSGVLAEWNGTVWKEIEQKQFTEITGPGDLYGNLKDSDPVWATGWDHRSVLVKLLENGKWYDYRLPKASFTYNGTHGWYTEWPRIRAINNGRRLMTMHGMFWNFPATFSTANTGGIQPLSSYLKIVPDFAFWNGNIVFGSDDASTFGNPLVGRSQSNLWFVKPDQLTTFGPRSGYGGPWVRDDVKTNEYSVPFLIAGFDKKVLHLAHSNKTPVTFTIETDQLGNNKWTTYKKITVPAWGYLYDVFPADLKATWVRIKSSTESENTISYFALSQKSTSKLQKNPELFASLPAINSSASKTFGLIRAGASDDLVLSYLAYTIDANGNNKQIGYYEVDGNMKMSPVKSDTMVTYLTEKISVKSADFTMDNASVIYTDKKGNRFRLPKGDAAYAGRATSNWLRGIREVATERSLFNCNGTFYELPREISSDDISGIRPISTHNRMIYDFCSWRGMMVIAGNLSGAKNNGNYFKSSDGKTGLWFGTIDDLWKFGKPYGEGGPWKNTPVKAGAFSDPYLMTGYDDKSLVLSHQAGEQVTFTVEVDITSRGDWKTFHAFIVKPGENLNYQFPDGYSAHWIRLKVNKACNATAMLTYK